MLPDFDRPDDEPADDLMQVAGTAESIEDDTPFVGAVFKFVEQPDGTEKRVRQAAYRPEAPGTLTDVVSQYKPGVFVFRTAAGYPHPTTREFTIEAGTPERRVARAPVNPVVPPDALADIERRAVETARRELAAERSEQADEARRLRSEVADLEARVTRSDRTATEHHTEAQTLRVQLTAAREEANRLRTELGDARLAHAEAVGTLTRKHLNEIDRYRTEASELRAEATVNGFKLTMAENGEGVPASSRWADLAERVAGPLLERVAEAYLPDGDDEPDDDDTAAGATMPPALPPYGPPAYASGDGLPAEPAFPPPPAPPPVAPDVAPRADAPDVFAPVAQGAVAAVLGAAGAPSPAEFVALVERARAANVPADGWKGLARLVLREAVDHAADPDRVAAYLAPVAAPFAETLSFALALPSPSAVTMILKTLGLDVGKDGRRYVGTVVKALKPALAAAAAAATGA